MKIKIYKIILFTILSIPCFSQPGTLDLSFNTTGFFQAQFYADEYHNVNKVLVQPDGKILGTGYSELSFSRYSTTFRLNTNGTLDQSFATGGYSTVSTASSFDSRMNAMVLQPDGKIITGGRALQGSDEDMAMLRYNTDGTFDTSFGIGGGVVTDLSSVSFQGRDQILSLLLQPDGKIIAGGGRRTGNSTGEIAVVRYHDDGIVDSTFGTNGIVTFPSLGGVDEVYASALQPDGKILLTATCQTASNIFFGRTVRLNPNGSIDNGFGNNGMFDVTGAGTSWVEMHAMTLQPDGKIVLGANTNASANNDLFCVRLDTSGNPDNSFGNGGFAYANAGLSALGFVTQSILLQPDGKIVVGGFTGASFSLLAFRFNSDGTPDNGWGTNGLVNLNTGQLQNAISSLAIQSDGFLICGGASVPSIASNGSWLTVYRMENQLSPAAINEVEDAVSFYPNPASNQLYIKSIRSVNEIRVYDLSGRMELQLQPVAADFTVDVNSLKDGNYILQLIYDDQILTKKLSVFRQ